MADKSKHCRKKFKMRELSLEILLMKTFPTLGLSKHSLTKEMSAKSSKNSIKLLMILASRKLTIKA